MNNSADSLLASGVRVCVKGPAVMESKLHWSLVLLSGPVGAVKEVLAPSISL
jgi:hypothetical protein